MKAPKVSFVSLGGAKKLVDSEALIGHLAKGEALDWLEEAVMLGFKDSAHLEMTATWPRCARRSDI